MAIFRRQKGPRDTGMSPFRAGLIALIVIAIGTYFGFTKANPFASPYELTAAFDTVNNLKPNSPVRIAGVDMGKVTEVEALTPGDERGAAIVTMEIKDKGLPIHEDATMKIRPRIFLEGNFFVDVHPGSPSAPELEDDEKTVPTTQTSAPVQFGDLLAALQSDTRADLQVFLQEYAKGLQNGGAEGFNKSIPYWEPAYKFGAIANDASLGVEPTRDIQRLLKGQAGTARGLAANEEALKGVVTNLNITTGALAREDAALEASIPLLRSTLRVAQPALSLAQQLAAVAAPICDRRAAGRKVVRAGARGVAALHQAAPRSDAAQRAAGPGRGAAHPGPAPRGAEQGHHPAARTGARALRLHEQGARAVREHGCAGPRLPGEHRVDQPQDPALLPGPLGREPPLRRQRPSTSHGSAVALGDSVRPGSPTDGGNQPPPAGPTSRASTSRFRTCTLPAGPQPPTRSPRARRPRRASAAIGHVTSIPR